MCDGGRRGGLRGRSTARGVALLNENPRPIPAGRPRTTSDVVARSPACRPLRDLYRWAVDAGVTSWNQVEARFLEAMGEFDTTLAATATAPNPDALDNLVGDLQNGKGDFFNDLLALLLEDAPGSRTCTRGPASRGCSLRCTISTASTRPLARSGSCSKRR